MISINSSNGLAYSLIMFVFLIIQLASVVQSALVFGFKTSNAVFISAPNSVSINGIAVNSDLHWLRNLGN